MVFKYEITADEFVSSQILYHNASGTGRKRVKNGVTWIITGSLFIALGFNQRVINWTPMILALVGAWWIYAGVMHLFPARYFRRAYSGTELTAKRYKASVNEDGFEVTLDLCSWNVRWPSVRFKGENSLVFMLYSEGTIFTFGKKYLSGYQQQELRRLSGLDSRPKLETAGSRLS